MDSIQLHGALLPPSRIPVFRFRFSPLLVLLCLPGLPYNAELKMMTAGVLVFLPIAKKELPPCSPLMYLLSSLRNMC